MGSGCSCGRGGGVVPMAVAEQQPNHALEPTPTTFAPTSLRLLARVTASVRRHCNALDNDERRQTMLTNHMNRRVFLGASAASAVMATTGTVLAQQPAPAQQTPRVKGPLVWLDMDQAELDAAYD